MLLRRPIVTFAAVVLAAVFAACAADVPSTDAGATLPAATTTITATPAESTSTPGGLTVGVTVATGSVTPAATFDPLTSENWGQVLRVVDGDTVDLQVAGEEQRVRLILIDTPEVFGGTECYGPEASARTKVLLPAGALVELVRDVSETDSFGRLLRYVYLPDGRMVNEVLVAEGYATLATYPPDVAEVDRIRAAQTAARDAGLGLWSACAATATPAATTATPAKTATAAATPTVQANCDASYPDVCIPPYPPDLDCGEIPFRRFRVTGADPHGFDRDRDGIGCES